MSARVERVRPKQQAVIFNTFRIAWDWRAGRTGELTDENTVPTMKGPLTVTTTPQFPALPSPEPGEVFTERTVLLASPRSLCAGVERAIATVDRALAAETGPVYVRKQIVHNAHVVAGLEARGVIFVEELDEIPDPPPAGTVVIFSAHGVAPAVRREAERRGLSVIDATCPLVTKVHAEARRFAGRGDTIVLIGHDGHEEVQGTLGEAPGEMALVESVADVERLRVDDPRKVAYLTQTTLAVDETTGIVGALRARFPLLGGPGSDDICYATTNRQRALTEIARQADVVLVIGSDNSSNSVRLVELARRAGARAFLIDGPEGIDPQWLEDAAVIGLTAGASAPHHLVDDVIRFLERLGPLRVTEQGSGAETVEFALPREVRGQPEHSGPLLARLTGPGALAGMASGELPELASEIRGFLVEKVGATGGHLGVNLGVVELTIALHRVFRSPHDVLLFDTGHQAYVHKILTGRAAGFSRLRQRGGLSGYPSRAESPHDWVGNSHASTALAYADGMASALRLRGELGDRRVVAVIGDGALTGGLAFEGLNNLSAAPERPVIVVLNDNARSYSPTVGGLARHLASLRGECQDEEPALAGYRPVSAGTVFGQLGLAYVGPVDGHDIAQLEQALRQAVALNRTVVVHVVTRKGKGYGPAEADEIDRMHGIGVLDPATGQPVPSGKPSWTDVFGAEIVKVARKRTDIVCVTAAMLNPVGLRPFADAFPVRVFDAGIAEQHAVCSAAGLALGGLHPVVCVYSTFLGRAFDQVLMDVAMHRLPVTLVLDRAGITGPDGPSHHGMWDTAILAAVPGLRLAAPRDPARLRELLREAVAIDDGPAVLRFPKASVGPDIPAASLMDGLDILHQSNHLPFDVLIVAAGVMASPCLRAARILNERRIGVTVVDPRWILPAHPAIADLAARHRLAVTVEDGVRTGGAGSVVAQACADAGVATPFLVLGLPRRFIDAGSRAGLLEEFGLTGDAIAQSVLKSLGAA
jgi:(E)-4-hydroxy-3-methyl-but-2-enyl pyrophosphate reductase